MAKIMFDKINRYIFLLSVFLLCTATHSIAQQQCTEVCNWYSTIFPLCESQDDNWGWENSQSCIGRNVCSDQWGDGGVVSQCEEDNSDAELCASLEGRTYYTNHLFNVGLEYPRRRLLHFSGGEYEQKISHFVEYSGTYRCENGQVIASVRFNDNYVVEFSDGINSLSFNHINHLPRYKYRLASDDNADCSLVENSYYEMPNAVSAPWLSFGLLPDVAYGLPGSGGYMNNPQFDCDSGALVINHSIDDDSPFEAKIENGGDTVLLKVGDGYWSFQRDNSLECGNLVRPVCSVERTEVNCTAENCPSGIHKTFDNRCESDRSGAEFLRKGACGFFEGQPYYESTGTACSGEYAPVCGAKTQVAPCFDTPCPIEKYKTFHDICQVINLEDASFINEGECENEGERILQNRPKDIACGAGYTPICAKDEGGTACVTTPCNTHTYKTYGNLCEAVYAVTDIVWQNRDCGSLQNLSASSFPPVHLVESLTEVQEKAKVETARIEDDHLYLYMHFTGCFRQNFELEVSEIFAESLPVQANWVLVPQIYQQCQEEVYENFVFDLLPLKAFYEENYGSGPATIILPGLVDYKINQ